MARESKYGILFGSIKFCPKTLNNHFCQTTLCIGFGVVLEYSIRFMN